VRDVAFWLSGAALAFFLTAGAFLLLANLATVPSEQSLAPDSPEVGSERAVELALDAEQLASLRPQPDQTLDLVVKNEGGSNLSNVNVTLGVSSENTALSNPRYYRQTVEMVPAGETAGVDFVFDLSEPEQRITGRPASEPARNILEIKATTPEGVSTVRTVILPP
jgi:hypothetical protein